MTRRGFTVVEVLVATLVAALVIALAWAFFTSEQRRFRADQSRLSGLQGAMQMDEALAWDLERIALQLPDMGPVYTIDAPVAIEQAGRRLAFRIFAQDAPRALRATARLVSYRLDERTGRVMRAEGGTERAFPGLIADDVGFTLVRVPPRPVPGLFTFNALAPLHAIKYVVTCYSEALRDTPERERREHETVTLVGAVALPFRQERAQHPYWRGAPGELVR